MTLIDKTFKINSSYKLINKDMNGVKTILQKNNFPLRLIGYKYQRIGIRIFCVNVY